MIRRYEDVTAKRRAKLDPSSKDHAHVFEQAYQIAMQVVDLRERHGLTQSQLAKRYGMDQPDISRIERGSTSPTSSVIMATATSVPIFHLQWCEDHDQNFDAIRDLVM